MSIVRFGLYLWYLGYIYIYIYLAIIHVSLTTQVLMVMIEDTIRPSQMVNIRNLLSAHYYSLWRSSQSKVAEVHVLSEMLLFTARHAEVTDRSLWFIFFISPFCENLSRSHGTLSSECARPCKSLAPGREVQQLFPVVRTRFLCCVQRSSSHRRAASRWQNAEGKSVAGSIVDNWFN